MLSWLPLAALTLDGEIRHGFAVQQRERQWQERATGLLAEVRAGADIATQIRRMAGEMTRQYKILLRRDQRQGRPARGDGAWLYQGFVRGFPGSHRPLGTLLYAFGREADGRLVVRRGEGLATANGRMIADLIGALMTVESAASAQGTLWQRRCAGVFGADTSFRVLARERKGRPTPVDFAGRPSLALWNTVAGDGREVVAYLLVVPFHVGVTARPLVHALEHGAQTYPGVLPVLVPLPQAGPECLPLFPRSHTIPDAIRAAVGFWGTVDAAGRRPLRLTGGIHLPGWWLRQELVAADQDYEVWALSPIPYDNEGVWARMPWIPMVVPALFWLFVGLRTVVGHRPIVVTVRLRVLFDLYFLAGLALVTLYLFATYYLETASIRQQQDRVRTVMARLEDADAETSGVFGAFAAGCEALLRDSLFSRDLFHPDAARNAAAAAKARARFAGGDSALELEAVLAYDFHRQRRLAFVEPTADAGARGALDYLAPFFENVAGRLDPAVASISVVGGATSEAGRRVGKIIHYGISGGAYTRFFYRRQLADFYSAVSGHVLQYYDFIASGGTLLGGVILRARPDAAIEHHFRAALDLVAGIPGEPRLAFGRTTPTGGLVPLMALRGGWQNRGARRLLGVMATSARTGAVRVSTRDDEAVMAVPCQTADGFVLGGVISLRDIRIDAAVLRGRLRVFVVVVLALILALGLAVSNHLLEPLAQLEVGLVRVAGGDLSARVRLERDDELGELATTFDRMIHDFEERQMLGRFVSGALDLDALRVERPGESGLQECLGVVLVSDMRDFTTLTEKHPARSIVSLLNRHHQAMAAAIQQCGGFVEHFIGDAVVGYFAEPGPGAGARRAVRAAWTMMQAHARLNAERSAAGEFNYAIGVGIDRGLLLVGAIGSGERRDRVLIGAPRDRAEHLEALSKKGHLSRIMVSPAVVRFCARSRFVALPDDDQTWELASWADDEVGEAAVVRA